MPLSVVSVVDHGAVGDGVTDDGLAFQDAIDAVEVAGGGVVSVPATSDSWIIESRTLLLPTGVSLIGATQATDKCVVRRTGTDGDLINCTPFSVGNRIESLTLIGKGGHCIDYNFTNNARFADLLTVTDDVAAWGLFAFEAVFDCVMTNIRCVSVGLSGNGLMVCGHTNVFGFGASGCIIGLGVTGGYGISVHGFRCEVNQIGMRVGWDHLGNPSSGRLALYDGTFESNGTSIRSRGTLLLRNVASSAFDAAYTYTGTENGGLDLVTSYGSIFEQVSVSSDLPEPSLKLGDARENTFRNVTATHTSYVSPQPGWDFTNAYQENLNAFKFTNFPGAGH